MGSLDLTDIVEFGRVTWRSTPSSLGSRDSSAYFVVPAYLTIPTATVNLDGILTKLLKGTSGNKHPLHHL